MQLAIPGLSVDVTDVASVSVAVYVTLDVSAVSCDVRACVVSPLPASAVVVVTQPDVGSIAVVLSCTWVEAISVASVIVMASSTSDVDVVFDVRVCVLSSLTASVVMVISSVSPAPVTVMASSPPDVAAVSDDLGTSGPAHSPLGIATRALVSQIAIEPGERRLTIGFTLNRTDHEAGIGEQPDRLNFIRLREGPDGQSLCLELHVNLADLIKGLAHWYSWPGSIPRL